MGGDYSHNDPSYNNNSGNNYNNYRGTTPGSGLLPGGSGGVGLGGGVGPVGGTTNINTGGMGGGGGGIGADFEKMLRSHDNVLKNLRQEVNHLNDKSDNHEKNQVDLAKQMKTANEHISDSTHT